MTYCACCPNPAPEGERLCAECFELDFRALKSRMKSPDRVTMERDRINAMKQMEAGRRFNVCNN